MTKEFLTGNEIIVKACLTAGAEAMFGYPITPTTEILAGWAKLAATYNTQKPLLTCLQTEDEMAAGFAMIGAILAGVKAFSATAGIGHTLMQDPLAMAEAFRLPTVVFIMQRGGPSTGQVIYSQQELNQACFGGNGEGWRIVYSTSGLQDLYDYTIKAFNTAWKYRFPTFVLGDGYQAKMAGQVEIWEPRERKLEIVAAEPIILKNLPAHFFIEQASSEQKEVVHLRNCFNMEEELAESITKIKEAYEKASPEIEEYEMYPNFQFPISKFQYDLLIFAHGIASASVKSAIDNLQVISYKLQLFRPITLRPFPTATARKAAQSAKKILIIESSNGQFARLVKSELYGIQTPIETYLKPAMGITPEEIVAILKTQITSE